MINDQYSPEEQAIIQQIQTTPRLEISASARESIRSRMLNEFRLVSHQTSTNPVPQTRLVALTVTAIIVVTVIVIIILAIISQNTVPQTAIATPIQGSATIQATAASTQIPPTIDSVLVITPVATTFSTASPDISATMALETEQILMPSVAPTLDAIVVIEGPVINIVNNVITIYDFEIEVEVNHPILNLIEPGDLVHIEGIYGNSGVVVASVVSNLSSAPLVTGATVSLDGPVEAINDNVIVVNGISVQLGESDPLLQTVQVGQFVSIQGNFQGSGTNIVLVVVTIVVNTNATVTENECWYHDGMGMGHWHCDGMGMGMGNAGMGMGMGMGMGDG